MRSTKNGTHGGGRGAILEISAKKMLRNIVKSIYNLNQIRSINSEVAFGFKLNRFNDIHIKANDVIKAFKEIDLDLNKFDSILKSY